MTHRTHGAWLGPLIILSLAFWGTVLGVALAPDNDQTHEVMK